MCCLCNRKGLLHLGIHTSIAGSLANAASRAAALGANTLQIFTASPRTWRATPFDPQQAQEFRSVCKRLHLSPVVVHDNYLINLASPDPALRKRSIQAFRDELIRSMTLEADFVVLHPGSCKGQSIETGIRTVSDSLVTASRDLKSERLSLLLENTAGSGSSLGSRFEELAQIRAGISGKVGFAMGYCLDTAHCLAAGYDISTSKGLSITLDEADRYLDLENVKVIHANDSKTPIGSHVDRHEHIGRGYIGIQGFRRILQHPRLWNKVFILETPMDREGDDRRNLQKLIQLCRKSHTTITRLS